MSNMTRKEIDFNGLHLIRIGSPVAVSYTHLTLPTIYSV